MHVFASWTQNLHIVCISQIFTNGTSKYTFTCLRPVSTVNIDDEDPYWKDHVEKYFACPHNETFEHITYPDYFIQYHLITKQPHSTAEFYKHDLNYFVVKRSNPIIVHFRYLKIQNGES